MGRLIGYEPYKGYLEALTKALVEQFGDSLLAVVLSEEKAGKS